MEPLALRKVEEQGEQGGLGRLTSPLLPLLLELLLF
jgi:hypothetical protein